MSPELEELAAELNLTGGSAWAQLYENFTSQISADVELEGEVRTLPMTAIRNLAFHEEQDVRRRAYEAELKAWERNATPIAAAMNSIKGQALTLSDRRGWESPLDVALYENNVDRPTLDVMLETAGDFFPIFRRYLQTKAQILGTENLPWYDLYAPVGSEQQVWDYETARTFILQRFEDFSPRLSALAGRAFDENWIDAEPREGKRGGAFCMWVRGGESRILANFQSAYGGMGTLAHELGHAYHNLARSTCTFLQRKTPMTLAETASNFCELIIQDAALETASPQEQLTILEAWLQDTCQTVVDISSRFLFEQAVFEKRRERTLSIEEFNALMIESQKKTYGDGLDQSLLHPYMWAVKPHYYVSVFYNFPYMFGLLFSLGLYARYRETPETFLQDYDELLSQTGMGSAAELAQRFDIDVRSRSFWQSSLEILANDVKRFEALVRETSSE